MSSFSMLLMSAFYIFNASQGKYLCIDSDGKASLSPTPTAIELTQTDDGTGRYDDSEKQYTWVFKNIKNDSQSTANPGKDAKKYTIGFQLADAYATGFLLATDQANSTPSSSMTSPVGDGIGISYAEPDASFETGIWQILSPKEVETEVVVLSEENTDYQVPSLDKTYIDVTFTRKFAKNAWNSLCVPFPITQEQLEAQFGQGTKVAVYARYDMTGKRLFFQTTDAVEAGIPCLLYPTSIHEDMTYSFKGIPSDDWARGTEPSDVEKDNQPTYKGTYKNMGYAPRGSYIFGGNNKMYYVDSDVTMKGFRGYFMDDNASVVGAKLLSWGMDDTTGIDGITESSHRPASDIYQMDGKLVKRKATSTEGLRPGVYIMNGMKVIVK